MHNYTLFGSCVGPRASAEYWLSNSASIRPLIANRDPEHYKRITATEILEEIAVLLTGRCAEIVKFGKDGMCAGASSDLSKASAIALKAITQFGLDKELGLLSVNGLSNELQQAINGDIIARVQDWKASRVVMF